MKKDLIIQKARETAEEYFDKGELYCSEAVVKTINDLLDKPFDDSIVKLSSGFAVGVGTSGCLCGAVSGGVMSLSMVYGRNHGEPMKVKMLPVSAELHNHIKKLYGSTCCRVLTKQFKESGSAEHKAHCMKITGDVAAFVAEKLLEDENIKLSAEYKTC